MPPRIARLAGLGAFGACAGIAALYLLIVWGTRPTVISGAMSGMDGTLRFLTWLSVGGVFLALLGVHVMLGRRLLDLSRGEATEV
jgi:predicted ferric reductase